MLAEVNRPFSPAERRLLRRRAAVPKIGSVFWMRDERRTLAWTLGICVGLLAAGEMFQQLIVASIAAMIFACVRLGGYHERCRLLAHQLTFRQRLAEELESGTAHSITCRPKRIIEREEFEDEGALWIFDGGEGRYLALFGQDYYETPRFPSSHFEVVIGTRHRTVIGIRSFSTRLPSTIVVTDDDIAWGTFPEQDVSTFAASPDAELPAILHAFRTMSAA